MGRVSPGRHPGRLDRVAQQQVSQQLLGTADIRELKCEKQGVRARTVGVQLLHAGDQSLVPVITWCDAQALRPE